MQKTEIFLVLTVTAIILLMLYQTVSIRIEFKTGLFVSVEYFPFVLLLYNFQKAKIKKKKLVKRTKRLLFFLSPIKKALAFLFRRTNTKITKLDFVNAKSSFPHTQFLSDEIETAIALYICSFFYTVSKTATINPISSQTENSDTIRLDLEFSTRFCNVIFAFLVFLLNVIIKKGRNVKIVR